MRIAIHKQLTLDPLREQVTVCSPLRPQKNENVGRRLESRNLPTLYHENKRKKTQTGGGVGLTVNLKHKYLLYPSIWWNYESMSSSQTFVRHNKQAYRRCVNQKDYNVFLILSDLSPYTHSPHSDEWQDARYLFCVCG